MTDEGKSRKPKDFSIDDVLTSFYIKQGELQIKLYMSFRIKFSVCSYCGFVSDNILLTTLPSIVKKTFSAFIICVSYARLEEILVKRKPKMSFMSSLYLHTGSVPVYRHVQQMVVKQQLSRQIYYACNSLAFGGKLRCIVGYSVLLVSTVLKLTTIYCLVTFTI